MDVKNKTIVITGAARGLGAEMAQALAKHGAKLALVDMDETELNKTVATCKKLGAQAKGYRTNITDEKAVETMFDAISSDFEGVHALINNAGITDDGLLIKAKDGKVIKKMSLDSFQKVISVDLNAVFLCAREAAAKMIQGGNEGVIINISSISRAGNVGQTNYSAAKAGVAAMTVTWAKELARYQIRAASIAPGFCATRMVSAMPSDIQDRITSTIPAKRFGRADEIADAVLFILQNDYFNGRVLEVDGGLRL